MLNEKYKCADKCVKFFYPDEKFYFFYENSFLDKDKHFIITRVLKKSALRMLEERRM